MADGLTTTIEGLEELADELDERYPAVNPADVLVAFANSARVSGVSDELVKRIWAVEARMRSAGPARDSIAELRSIAKDGRALHAANFEERWRKA